MARKRYIWRIWEFDSNDRQEIARIGTKGLDEDSEFETVQEFVLDEFIKPEFRSDVEKTEFGLIWDESTPEECLKIQIENGEFGEFRNAAEMESAFENDEYSPCESCDGCEMGLEIEFVGEEGSDWQNKPEFKTIYGTNEFYDLSEKKPKKASDWQKTLKKA